MQQKVTGTPNHALLCLALDGNGWLGDLGVLIVSMRQAHESGDNGWQFGE